jgi:hypothetical protein
LQHSCIRVFRTAASTLIPNSAALGRGPAAPYSGTFPPKANGKALQPFFFLGINMYHDSNILENAKLSPKIVAIIDSIV